MRWEKDNIFARTGGGLTLFRYNGMGLEVSFRNANGNTLTRSESTEKG